jgi:diguanylate cyclase (GGDEF)-like protein
MQSNFFNSLRDAWSMNAYASDHVNLYAQKLVFDQARVGLMTLSAILFILFSMETFIFLHFGYNRNHVYTGSLLVLLSTHVFFSARATRDSRTIYLLGTILLLISGTAFVLLAHQSGTFSLTLFAGITLLFMVIPVLPWGLREALVVLSLIYGTFTLSTWSSSRAFDSQILWSLQYIMLGAGLISLALVARNTMVRKMDIRSRFDLEQANKKMLHLSNKDPLTGAWNRRYLNDKFNELTERWHSGGHSYHFAFLDLDDFKPINDNFGHDFGDTVLRSISEVFSERLGDQGCLVRMGGDEFALLFHDENPEALIEDCLEAVNQSLTLPSKYQRMEVGISLGLVCVPPGKSATQEEIYREADTSLYQAKEHKNSGNGRLNLVSCTLAA